MKLVKLIMTFLVAFLFREANGQARVFAKAEEVSDSSSREAIVRLRRPWGNWGQRVIAYYKDGREESFKKKSIWGIELPNGEKLRFFNGNAYKVLALEPIVLYQKYSPNSVYYFSKNLSSDVRFLDFKELARTLSDEELVEAFKRLSIVRKWAY